jgi:hypothetical protein
MALLAAMLLVVLASGCSRGKEAEQVRSLRFAGQADSARTLALTLLYQNANRMPVWLEFVQSSLDEVRLRPNEEDHENDLDILVQACLVCSAIYQNTKHEPPREWRDTGKLLSAEVARQVNEQITAMTAQMQSTAYLKPMLTPVGSDTLLPRGPEIRARQLLTGYRSGARQYLYWSVVFRRLLESLPEVNPGTASLLAGQQDEAITAWSQALDLDNALKIGIQTRARKAIDDAMNHTLQDLRDLGYFLPQTIIENGVSP